MTEKSRVGLTACTGYGDDEVECALRVAVERAGGLPGPIPRSVLVKANALSPSPPEDAVTTNPSILRAIVSEISRSAGCVPDIRIADNPGYVFTDSDRLFKTTGMDALSAADGVSVGILSDLGARTVALGTFRTLREARISARYLDAPYCINAPKLKTHVETEMSGCIKNIFGTADIETRKRSHRSASQVHLADAIVDIYSIRPPDFNIVDAVVGMEGDGPSHGTPRQVGWIAAGRNALAVDWVLCRMMCFGDPGAIPLMSAAVRRGIGPGDESEIELVGAEWSEIPSVGFKLSSGALRALPTFLRGLAHCLLRISPALEPSSCVRCWICREVCPVGAIGES
ncbi:MAG: DUF362 domain-containing protein, partial [Synergistaceae bacterium]|nr:DUF362 domain-containing protein [Synergistaceae bacterium]